MSEMFMNANALKMPLANQSVDMCVTSPPYYGLRDYGNSAQLGLEETPEAYVANMVAVFREVWRVMKPQGVLFLNIGDSYASGGTKQTGRNDAGRRGQDGFAGSNGYDDAGGRIVAGRTPGLKPKDLIGIPWMLAFALRADGWYLRSDIIWHKPNPMPESVTDRPTKSHEYLFLLAKSPKYYYDSDAIAEESLWFDKDKRAIEGPSSGGKAALGMYAINKGGAFRADGLKNKRSVWTVTTKSYKGAHFATFPPDLIEPCIKAGCPPGGIVLDPFVGSGTTAWVSRKLERHCVGLDISFPYLHKQARSRLQMDVEMLL